MDIPASAPRKGPISHAPRFKFVLEALRRQGEEVSIVRRKARFRFWQRGNCISASMPLLGPLAAQLSQLRPFVPWGPGVLLGNAIS